MIFGIDISHWDGQINWDLAKSKLNFVFIKAFEYQEDSSFKAHWNGSRGKVNRGAYYFWRQSSDQVDKARTEEFLKVIGGSNYDGELPVVIDLEDNKANRSLVFKQMDRLSERIKQVTGRYPIIYTGISYWKEIGGNSVSQAWADAHPLWISLPNLDYSANFERDYKEILAGIKSPYIPSVKPFRKVDFIQWTYRGKPEDIPGYPRGINDKKVIDFNFFLGNEAEFIKLLKTTTNTNPPQIELTDKEKLEILWKEYQKTLTN